MHIKAEIGFRKHFIICSVAKLLITATLFHLCIPLSTPLSSPFLRCTLLSSPLSCVVVFKYQNGKEENLKKTEGKEGATVARQIWVSLWGSNFSFLLLSSRSLFYFAVRLPLSDWSRAESPGESVSANILLAGRWCRAHQKQQAAGKTLSQSCSNHSTTKDKCCGIAIILCFTPGLSWASAVLCLSAHVCTVTPYLILGLGGQSLHSCLWSYNSLDLIRSIFGALHSSKSTFSTRKMQRNGNWCPCQPQISD